MPDLDDAGRSKSCEEKRSLCHLCENMKDTSTFQSKHLDEIHKINKRVKVWLKNSSLFDGISDMWWEVDWEYKNKV